MPVFVGCARRVTLGSRTRVPRPGGDGPDLPMPPSAPTPVPAMLLAAALLGCGARTLDRDDPDGGAGNDPRPVAGEVDAGPCGPVRVECGGLCIDPMRDAEFCGASDPCTGPGAGEACGPEQACVGGGCLRVCAPGHIDCLGACIDPTSNDLHCGAGDCAAGAVGVACDDDEHCEDGACVPRCEPGLLACDAGCIDPLRDEAHCGARAGCDGDDRGEACADGLLCVGGHCTAGCPAGLLECDARCIDPYTDRDHCGALPGCTGDSAGAACGVGELCQLGVCAIACPAELLRCGERCVDPRYDREYCGADGDCREARAGTPCAPDQLCDDGWCRALCPVGLLSCEGGCTDPLSDPAHCGAAGDCLGPEAGSVCALSELCSAGRCVDACPAETLECEGGCIDPLTSRIHCGASGDCEQPLSGERCTSEEVCAVGSCVSSCGGALRRCDGLCTDVLHDRFHCGGCALPCDPGEDCFDGLCAPLCPQGGGGQPMQLLCDGQCIDPALDPRYCGASGLCVGIEAGDACEESEQCIDGSCEPICEGAFCGGQCTDTGVHPQHCGGCGHTCTGNDRCSDGDCLCVIHVRMDGDDGDAGTSWATAHRTVAAGLEAATAQGCALWVAQGLYPITDDGDRDTTLVLGAGTRLYGGFAGDETRLDARDIAAHPTRLTGELGEPGDAADNSRTLLTCIGELGCDEDTVVDGLTLEAAFERAMVIEDADPTLRNTRFTANLGGGLRVMGGAPSIVDCRFDDNFAAAGAGVELVTGAALLEGCSFERNVASLEGGGLFVAAEAQPALVDLRFIDNFALDGGGVSAQDTIWIDGGELAGNRASRGGAVRGPVVLDGVSLRANEAVEGGAVYAWRTVQTSNCEFIDNAAESAGGAIAGRDVAEVRIERCSFEGNQASQGGAIHYDGSGGVVLNDSRLRSNGASAGAGMFVRGRLVVAGATFVGHRASGEFASAIEQDEGFATVVNSLLWDNGPTPIRLIPTSGWSETHHSLVQGGCDSDCGAASDILDADPRLVSAPGGDLRLLSDSPCIDTGYNPSVSPGVLLDVAGLPRIVDGPDPDDIATVDMGAHEYQP